MRDLRVLLVHGLWRTPLSMRGLAAQARAWGYQVDLFGYVALTQAYESIVQRLAEHLGELGRSGTYAVVGYSLGGVLLRSALPLVDGPAPQHLIMLGTPNRPPRLACRLAALAPYRWLLGECGKNLATEAFYAALPAPSVPYTIIAGAGGHRGRWSPFGDELNDQIVAVSETRVRDDDPVILLPVRHAFMMNDAAVQQEVKRVLAEVSERIAA